MRMSRLAAGLVTAGLVGVVPVAVSSPAHAAVVGSTTTLAIAAPATGAPYFEVGDTLNISGAVTSADGRLVNTGSTATLQVSTPSVPAFTSIATDTSPSSLFFSGVTAQSNATYKVVFSGGTTGFGSTANTVTPSESAVAGISVGRTITAKTRRLTVIGKVTPDFARDKVRIERKAGKKFKKLTTVRANKKGRFTFRAPSRNGFKFVVIVPGDANFVATTSPIYTVRSFG